MISYLGNFAEDAAVYVMFNTFSSDDPSASCTITNFVNTDVHIHKDDGLAQRNNAAGITVSVDFDGITGSHMVKIDTSDDTVAGFWVVGHEYFVRIEGTTIDGATINSVIGQFSIENRFNEVDVVKCGGSAVAAGAIPNAAADAAGGLPISDAGGLDLDTKLADTNEITAARMGALTDWVNGGRLDLLLDAIPTTAMRGTDGANTTVPDAAGVAATPAEVATALTDINLDHLVKISVDTNWATTVHLDSVIGQIADVGTSATFDRTTDALEAIRDRGDAEWATATGFNTVVPDVAGTLATYDPPTNTEMVAAFTEIKGSTWAAGTDTLEHIRNKQTDIETDTGTTIPGTITTLQTDVTAIDVLTESGGSGDLAAIKTQIDAILDLERESGVVTVTDAETTLYEDASPTKNKSGVVVKIDMAALVSGDTFVVKEKYKDENGGSYQVVDELTYSGAQDNPLRIVELTPYRYGAIITMQRTAGTNRSIEWESFVEE